MNIQQQFIPISHKKTRPGIKMSPKYITVHETGNTANGANAKAHANLLSRGNTRTASWHFTVDDKEIYQHLPTNEVGWHAGDGGNGQGNRQSIGIEICVNRDGNFQKAKQNAIWLIKHLMGKLNIPIERVVPHKHWSGKNCPTNLLKTWTVFINEIKNGASSPPQSNAQRILKLANPLMKGEDVKKVQEKLGVSVDGIFGQKTRSAVVSFQKKIGLSPDGIVGPKTWEKLFPKTNPTPQPPPSPKPKPMYDLAITKDGQLVGVRSSRHLGELLPVVEKLIQQEVEHIELNKRK